MASDLTDESHGAARLVPLQERAQRSRAALLAAVEAVVAAEGAEAVTTTRIAAAAGVSVGTLYRYFGDRDALLVAAYDETVDRLIAAGAAALADLASDTAIEVAARRLLSVWIEAAEAMPAHAGLLAAVRAIRPVAAEQAPGRSGIVTGLVAPFFARFAPAIAVPPARLALLNVLLGTLVDLYLVTADPLSRAILRREIEAQILFALGRILSEA